MSTSIVALCGQKGGSGKTTLAVSLAAEWHARGKRVLLCDADPQGTATMWGDVAAENGVSGPAVVGVGDAIRKTLPGIAADYDAVVIDCPPRAGRRTVGALLVADLALLPCGPSPADLWALGEALDVVAQAQDLRPDLAIRIAMNSVLAASTLGSEVRDALAETGVDVLGNVIHSRVAFARTLATGLGVTVSEPRSAAAKEMRAWVDEVEFILTMSRPSLKVA